MTHQFHSTTLREYDIRGIIGETLGEADAYAIGRGFATLIARAGGSCVVVGYDGRVSSPVLEAALIRGLNDSGIDAVSVGMGPTPMLYYAEAVLEEADGGIQITGSHNPANYNGFKMVFQGRPFFGADIRKLGEMAAAGDWDAGTGTSRSVDILERYVDRLVEDFGGKAARVGWDCGNGAAGRRWNCWSSASQASTSRCSPKSTATFPIIILTPPKRRTSRTSRRLSPRRSSISEWLSTAMATGSARLTARAA